MPFSIQTKYAENSFKQGDVVAIRHEGFKYFEGDCLSKWLESGRAIEDYKYSFAITYCTNPEILEEYNQDDPLAPFSRRRFLNVPSDYDNINRKELRETGETSADWLTIKNLIVERD